VVQDQASNFGPPPFFVWKRSVFETQNADMERGVKRLMDESKEYTQMESS